MKHRAKPSRAALRVLCLSCALLSCATNGRVAGGGYWGTKGAVQGAVEEITELKDNGYLPNQQSMNRAVKEMAQSAVVGAVTGAKDGVKGVNIDAKIKSAIESALSATDAKLQTIVKNQTRLLGDLVEAVVSRSLSKVRTELQPTIETDLPKATHATVKEAVDTFAVSMQSPEVDAVQKDLVTMTGELTKTASKNAVIGLREELEDPKTGTAVGSFARIAVKEATGDFIDKLKKELIEKTEQAAVWARTLAILLAGAVALFLAAFAAVIFERRNHQKTQSSLAETKRALQFVVAQINEAERAGGGSVKAAIKAKAVKHAGHEEKAKMHRFLDTFLTDNGL